MHIPSPPHTLTFVPLASSPPVVLPSTRFSQSLSRLSPGLCNTNNCTPCSISFSGAPASGHVLSLSSLPLVRSSYSGTALANRHSPTHIQSTWPGSTAPWLRTFPRSRSNPLPVPPSPPTLDNSTSSSPLAHSAGCADLMSRPRLGWGLSAAHDF